MPQIAPQHVGVEYSFKYTTAFPRVAISGGEKCVYSHCKDQFAEFAKSFVFHPLCSKTIYEHISTILAVVVTSYDS